jgi:NADPH:quinone reductase-like Zn-dependent oxidoreductase
MKAFQIQDGFGIENLKRVDRPEVKPGPGQALVRIHAASLNYRDLMTIKGTYNPKQPLPLIPLSDGAGEVVAVGEGVERFKPGDRVCAIFAQRWLSGAPTSEARASTLGGPLDGMLVESAVFDQEGLVSVPPHLSYEEAATLPCAAVTAWHALVIRGHVKAGDTVLVQGTGGVSLFALQFALLSGARVIVTSSSDEKLERLKSLGPVSSINYKTEPDWDRRARDLTGGVGVDHVVEVGGAGTLGRSLSAAAMGGRISVIGVLSGTTCQLEVPAILMKGVTIQGVFVGPRDVFESMNRAIEQHGMRPVVGRVFPFQEAPEALRYLESGRHFGKVVIRL